MRYQQVVPVADNQIVLPLPQEFKGKRSFVITIEDNEVPPQESYEDEMRRAMQDPRFLADMHEVIDDLNT